MVAIPSMNKRDKELSKIRVWLTYLSSDDMTDLHQIIIDNVCKMVGRESIVFQNDLIINIFVIEDYFTMHDVFKSGLSFGHFHPNDKWLAICFLFFNLLLGVIIETEAIILSLCIFLPSNLNSHFLKPLSRAKARISITVLDKCVDELVINWETLALVIWTKGSKCFVTLNLISICLFMMQTTRALVPPHTCPFEHVDNVINRSLHLSLLVRVFNPQNHVTPMHLCKQVVVKECSQATNMHHSCGAWRISDSHFVLADLISAIFLRCNLANVSIVGIDLSRDVLLAWTTWFRLSCRWWCSSFWAAETIGEC